MASRPSLAEGLPYSSPEDIEYLYEDDVGLTHSSFNSGLALAALLLSKAAFLNSNWFEDSWPEEAKKTVAICINTSDVFAWGTADAETIPYNKIEEVYRYWVKDRTWGTAIWAVIVSNKELPQKPVADAIRKAGIWDLDALQKEHNLRPNYYDGVSRVLANRKRRAYEEWCKEIGQEPLPFDSNWWEGWNEYAAANPDWNNEDWKKDDEEAVKDWRRKNGWLEEPK